ncbi:MAG: hypothetical protein AAF495_18775 [Pseudomonadota bacterium]
MAGKVVIVHSLAQAKAALAAARELNCALTLASAPGASATVGVRWFQAVAQEAGAAYPEVVLRAEIDCADRPGEALAALRCGFKSVRFSGKPAVAAKLKAIAAQQGAEIVTGRPKALDLLEAADPERATRDWLAP